MSDDDDRPWGEARWEAFMRDADLRAARFQERLETEFGRLERGEIDEVDHDAIADDMGWTGDGPDLPEPTAEEMAEAEAEDRAAEAALQKIAAYRLSLRLDRQIRKLLRPHDRTGPADDDAAERWGAVLIAAAIAGAKISGGHAMGTDDEHLCGNIVTVRRGLAAVVEGRAALASLVADGHLAPPLAAEVDGRLVRLVAAIEEHLAALRARVWWE